MTTSLSHEWQFENPVKINFGEGVRMRIAECLPQEGTIVLISTKDGRKRTEVDPTFASLIRRRNIVWVDNVEENPDIDAVQVQIDRLRPDHPVALVAIGGGSVIDTAKGILAGLGAPSQATLRQLLAVPALMSPVATLELHAVPTTSGTGSEVTPFATLWDYSARKKLSVTGKSIFPKAAYVDPDLTLHLPEAITVSTGLDALNQAAESIWNRNANPITLQFAYRALEIGMRALTTLFKCPGDVLARRAMAESSLLAGLAISHTRTALCHSMSYPLTSHFGVPHGLACAFTMKAVFDLNAKYDDGRMMGLATILSLPNLSALGELIASCLSDLDVHGRVLHFIPSFSALMDLQNDMVTPGRADNSLAPIDSVTIRQVLEESYRGARGPLSK